MVYSWYIETFVKPKRSTRSLVASCRVILQSLGNPREKYVGRGYTPPPTYTPQVAGRNPRVPQRPTEKYVGKRKLKRLLSLSRLPGRKLCLEKRRKLNRFHLSVIVWYIANICERKKYAGPNASRRGGGVLVKEKAQKASQLVVVARNKSFSGLVIVWAQSDSSQQIDGQSLTSDQCSSPEPFSIL